MTRLRAHTRGVAAAVALATAMLGLTGCVGPVTTGNERFEIAGGGTTGVYYAYGEELAGALHRELGIDIAVEETHGSVDNLLRVAAGEALLGFAQGDTAADAVRGDGYFAEPLPVRAAARVYDEYVHLVVPAESEVRRIADLEGRRVSLGAPNSGVQVIATRVLASSDVATGRIENPELGLDASIEAMQRGEIDAFFWVGGLPTPGIERLAEAMPIRLLSIEADTVDRVNEGHAGVYRLADFPVGVYGIETPAVTMTVPNYLIASEDAPEELIYDVVRVLFDSRQTIGRRVAAGEFLDRRQAIFTAPVELHPGAERYYVDARR
ncbi:TAXI family TRAP transporter solute-binding subunit [Leucobacter chironomi]|uniref:TAXI family TRAP transporter solute-binding subunit n=1 Tax=Leucobacter chironomi TaxID=491918 RepID=UPI0004193D99|nr:TAXI family TRAP transporter solute-binding subunit [Leucobacter chironomi]